MRAKTYYILIISSLLVLSIKGFAQILPVDSLSNNQRFQTFQESAHTYPNAWQHRQAKTSETFLISKIEKRQSILLLSLVLLIFFLFLGWYNYLLARQQNKKLFKQQEVLQLETDKLKQLNTTKDKLFAIISHDLRGPIGGLDQVLTLLLSKELSEAEFLNMADDLKQNTTNVHQMLNNLLQWSYAQMNDGIIPDSIVLNPSVTLQHVLNFLDALAKSKKLHIENMMPQDLWVQVDAEHLNLIFRNLISNAIKYTASKGQIQINAVEKKDIVVFSISDTGIGMSEVQIEKICKGESEPRAGTAGEKGVGLGLTLCKEMILKNGGTVNIESTVGKGSTFYFSLARAAKTEIKPRNVHFSSVDPHPVSNPFA